MNNNSITSLLLFLTSIFLIIHSINTISINQSIEKYCSKQKISIEEYKVCKADFWKYIGTYDNILNIKNIDGKSNLVSVKNNDLYTK